LWGDPACGGKVPILSQNCFFVVVAAWVDLACGLRASPCTTIDCLWRLQTY
jgi:hypothetical protein